MKRCCKMRKHMVFDLWNFILIKKIRPMLHRKQLQLREKKKRQEENKQSENSTKEKHWRRPALRITTSQRMRTSTRHIGRDVRLAWTLTIRGLERQTERLTRKGRGNCCMFHGTWAPRLKATIQGDERDTICRTDGKGEPDRKGNPAWLVVWTPESDFWGSNPNPQKAPWSLSLCVILHVMTETVRLNSL